MQSYYSVALHTHGVPGLDDNAWRRTCFSLNLHLMICIYQALAAVGRYLCSSYVHPEDLSAFVPCKLITLNKCPGVRPIGIGEIQSKSS